MTEMLVSSRIFLKWKGALYSFLKKEMGSLVAFEMVQEHIRALFKNGERFARIF